MSDYSSYSTGWYSISPSFAWWNSSLHPLVKIKARKEAERLTEQEQKQIAKDKREVVQGTISVYA
tara:strand:+ start:1879 stop:2073 length:195 start_codon:yes stop_codon:yes gene_type:complete